MSSPKEEEGGGKEKEAPKEDAYIKTTTGNFVSRMAEITNASNVEIKGRSWIEQGVTIRGDLAKIRMGRYCKLSTGTTLEPAPATPQPKVIPSASASSSGTVPPHIPVVIGSHTIVGPHCQIRAAAIGSYCWIGSNVQMGKRVIIKDACVVDDNVVLGDDTVVPPFTRVTMTTISSTSGTISPSAPTPAAAVAISSSSGSSDSTVDVTTTTPEIPLTPPAATTRSLHMLELPPATIQLLQEESMETYNSCRKSIQSSA